MILKDYQRNQNETLIKFLAPRKLKHALEELAAECNVVLPAVLRLVLSEYVRRTRQTGEGQSFSSRHWIVSPS